MSVSQFHNYTPPELEHALGGTDTSDTGSLLSACIVLAGMVGDLQAQVKQLNKALATVVHMPDESLADYRHIKGSLKS